MQLWNDDYILGYKEIDEEHEEVLNQIGTLLQECYKGKENLLNKFLEVKTCLINHCEHEERFMTYNNYHNSDSHKAHHREIIKQLEDYENQVKNGGLSISIVLKAVNTLSEVILNHIQEEDNNLVRYIR